MNVPSFVTMSRLRLSGLACLLIALATGTACVTPQKTTAKKSVAKKPLVVRDKSGTKGPGDGQPAQADGTPTQAAAAVPPPVAPTPFIPLEKRQTQFLQTHLTDESKAVTDDDERNVLPQPPDIAGTGTVAEACVAVAVMKKMMAASTTVKTGSFVEQDTASGEKSKSPMTIESLAQQRSLDFPKVIETNPFLQSPAAQRMALKAIDKSSDSQAYKDKTFGGMRRITDQWTSHQVSLNKAMGAATIAAMPAQTAPGSMDTQPGAGTGNALTGPPGVTKGDGAGPLPEALPPSKQLEVKAVEVGKEDAALSDAQNLADAGKYQEAIAKASGISNSSAAYPKAQDRIKTFANRAVQELRMKAAQAFQGSLPISDPKARTAYLERARKFLEEAIKTYPQADQLGTVKENLAVITRDIEKMKDETKR